MKKLIAVLLLLAALSATDLAPHVARAQSQDVQRPVGALWNKGSTGASTNLFTSALKTTAATSIIRIGVVVGSSVKLSIVETNGTQTFSSYLNAGNALAAGTMYTFVWEMRNSDGGSPAANITFNFQMDGTSTVPILRVTEVIGAVD